MPDKINSKEVNHHYLLLRSLLSGGSSCTGTFKTRPCCRAKRMVLDVQPQMSFSEQAQGLVHPKTYLGGVSTAGICLQTRRGWDVELTMLLLRFHVEWAQLVVPAQWKLNIHSQVLPIAIHSPNTYYKVAFMMSWKKKKRLASCLFAYLGAYGTALQKRHFWSEGSLV